MTPDALARAAADALQRGDGAEVCRIATPLARANPAQPQLWLLLGEGARIAGDDALLEEAATQLIAAEPRAIRGYGWRGDVALRRDEERAAARWYRAGVATAAALPDLSASLAQEQARQAAALAKLEAGFAAAMDDGLKARGVVPDAVSPRFAEAIDLLNGRAEVQLQKPAAFYFPDLPQRAFYEREEFDWVASIESQTGTILAELSAILTDDALFRPYLTSDPDRPSHDNHGMTDNPDWSSLHLIDNGVANAAAITAFPATLAAVNALPLCRIGVRAPTVMFSRLAAGARIPPHHGMINARLVCHLPMIVPGPGKLKVGNYARDWEPGKLLIFDDSMRHEAWNDADADRIVLLFDVWRPELTQPERDAVVALFDVIDAKGE